MDLKLSIMEIQAFMHSGANFPGSKMLNKSKNTALGKHGSNGPHTTSGFNGNIQLLADQGNPYWLYGDSPIESWKETRYSMGNFPRTTQNTIGLRARGVL
jgi:hypothetical protein